MNIFHLHKWDLDFTQAKALQHELQPKLNLNWQDNKIQTIAGCDVSGEFKGKRFYAAVVAMSYPELDFIEQASASGEISFPYVPGLLSFREMPVLLRAFEGLQTAPDVIFCDGSGTIHPRKFGLACHLGLWLNLPVIGVAKNLLCGEYYEVGNNKGDWSPVYYAGETVGAALRSRTGVRPIFISPGNHITIEKALEFTLQTCTAYRLPQSIRAAHHQANFFRKFGKQ